VTSRQRVLTALNHEEPDRVPFDLGSTTVSGIQQKAYVNLLAHMGESDRELLPISDIKQQLATPHQEVLDELGVDLTGLVRYLGRGDEGEIAEGDCFYYMYDVWGIGWHMPKTGGLYYDMFDHPLDGASLADARAYHWPDPVADLDLDRMEQIARKAYKDTDKAIVVGGFGAGILELYQWLLGYEHAFVSLVADQALARFVLEKITELKMAYDAAVLPVVGQYAHIYYKGDDLGHQQATALSPQMLGEMIIPLHKRQNEQIRRLTPHLKIFYHTCGSVYQVIADLIDSGIDILNPVQVSAAQMGDTARLKREFGDELTFWGAVDTQSVMPHGTPQQIKDEVKQRLDDLAPGGGYVLNTVHNIQGDVPPENIMALAEALDEYGWY